MFLGKITDVLLCKSSSDGGKPCVVGCDAVNKKSMKPLPVMCFVCEVKYLVAEDLVLSCSLWNLCF